jgi:UDP-N-acetylmuramoyl-L-alanyl-D-glutamate--2,6-diaminopimelate ligase
MDEYFEAKAQLFEHLQFMNPKKPRAVINLDDRYGHRLIERYEKTLKLVTFGQGVHASFRASSIRYDQRGTQFQLDARGKSYLVRSPLIGLFNVYNVLGALAAVTCCGVELRASIAALAHAPQVRGRVERVPGRRNFQVFVDYAHTDDALRNVLRTLRELNPERLITVFGCGGDRDRSKRPLMAAASEEFSDYTIITTDNPRGEDPERIIADIAAGMRGRSFEKITDRESAIRRAVDLAQAGDIVVIAGKGHESYQEAHGVRTPFDDVTMATRAMQEKRGDDQP